MERWRDRFREDPERGLRPFFGGMITEGNRSVYVCGEGHDMLYAHFGVCRYKDIVVDYNKTVEEVYIEFWTHVMNKVKDINFLTAVEDNNGEAPKRKWKRTPDLRGIWKGKINLRFRPPLPTWVPDFQVPRNPSSLTQHYTMTNPDGGFDICKFHVSRGYQLPKTTFEIDGHNHLILKGFHFDTVRETSECASELISKHARCIPNFLNLIASVMYDDRVYCTAEERISAICHTLVVWSRSSASIEQDILEDLDNVRKLLSLWLLYNLSIPGALSKKSEAITAQRALLTRLSDDERMRGLLPTTQEVDAEAAEHGHFLRTRVENLRRGIDAPVFVDERVEGYVGRTAVSFGDFALRGLRMFRTKQGFVGKGPVNILRGDEIWIFPGAYVPFILRRGKQGEYALVGHCYIHGIMDGEIVDSLRKREPEVVNIV